MSFFLLFVVFILGYLVGRFDIASRFRDSAMQVLRTWYWTRPVRKVFRSSVQSWKSECCSADVRWVHHECRNCEYWANEGIAAHMLHASIEHVYEVRSKPTEQHRRSCSTTRSALGAWKRSQDHGETLFVYELASPSFAMDICNMSRMDWFSSFVVECLKANRSPNECAAVAKDVSYWAQKLQEVIVDRAEIGRGCAPRAVHNLTPIQSFAVWMEWDMLLSAIL